ncbi:disintegrin and metalloproteinase domain-containing protein 10-like [Haemaphysalis longicornis]|uniref:ADAM10 endopeptidase n=1 Tax=Haemaphysalis longicornis TaxID=44386 RepID=A0A9J6FTR3_HAELO|nr:hypothetical protein HPB48_018076 [Haemaphysalis longicornis]
MTARNETTAPSGHRKKGLFAKVFLVLLHLPARSDAAELGPFIRNYELLSYPVRVGSSNSSVKRIRRATADTSGTRHIRFNARGRHFHLVLSLDLSAFSNNFVARTSLGPVEVDLSHAVSGYVYGDAGSHAFGSILGGVFEGRISTGDGRVFYVEPAWRYPTLSPQSGHSVFYASEDVRLPPVLQGTHGGCGLDRLQKHLADEEVDLRAHQGSHPWPSPQHRGRRIRRSPDIAEYPEVGTQEPLTRHRTFKGQIGARQGSNRRLCHLQISVDHILYKFYAKGVDDPTARARIASLVNTHITSVNEMYSKVDFNGIVGIQFVLQDLRINDSTSCDSPHMSSSNPFCRTDLDANLMLKFYSYDSRNDFCLSYVWTNRDLGDGTLGLAYLASPDNIGGICEKFKNVNTREGLKKLALNSGVVTFLLHGGQVSLAVSEVTLAHEFGHSFGSPHDESRECAPGGARGNYIMYPRATTGLQPNNRLFSSCSVKNISLLLQALFDGRRDRENCFLANQQPFCGNNVREAGEECDCGYQEVQCTDKCCNPAKNQAGKAGCTLTPTANCSPSAGSCCSDACGFRNTQFVCAVANECNEQSLCNGVDDQCPQALHKPNLVTECNNGTQVCVNGSCQGSICLKYQFEDCQRVSGSPAEMCLVACKQPGSEGPCLDTCNVQALQPLCGKKRERGAACNDNRGYCDVFHRCRTVDEGGPLDRLQKLLVPKKLRDWVSNNMWALVAIFVVFLLAVIVFIRICAVMTPTNNPRLPRAKTFRESVRRPL